MSLEMALRNIKNMFARIPGDQICGVWPNGATVTGDEIKAVVNEFQAEVVLEIRRLKSPALGEDRREGNT